MLVESVRVGCREGLSVPDTKPMPAYSGIGGNRLIF